MIIEHGKLKEAIGMSADQSTGSWVRTWQTAGPLLAEIERRELERMTDEEWRQAVDDVLSVIPPDAETPSTSGLVEQQKWFGKLHQKSGS
jgi:hypothetical protein